MHEPSEPCAGEDLPPPVTQSFRGCENLKYVYCDGGMPRFNDSCLWTGGYVSVFYPTNNPWPSEYTSTLISSYGGNLGITMGTFDPNNLPTSGETTDSTEDGEKTDNLASPVPSAPDAGAAAGAASALGSAAAGAALSSAAGAGVAAGAAALSPTGTKVIFWLFMVTLPVLLLILRLAPPKR